MDLSQLRRIAPVLLWGAEMKKTNTAEYWAIIDSQNEFEPDLYFDRKEAKLQLDESFNYAYPNRYFMEHVYLVKVTKKK